MRTALVLAISVLALVLLATVAVGIFVSISRGRSSVVLTVVFIVDSFALVGIAGQLLIPHKKREP